MADQRRTKGRPISAWSAKKCPAPGISRERMRKTRSRRESSFWTSSSFWLRAGPDTPSRTTNRWWHCVHNPPVTTPRWQRRQNGVPHFRQRMVNALDPRHRPRPTKVSTNTRGKALKRLMNGLLPSHAGCASGLPATFFAPMPSRNPANFAQTWPGVRLRSTTA